MEQLRSKAAALRSELDDALERIGFAGLQAKLDSLAQQVNAPDFWSDSSRAQTVSREQAALEKRLAPWRQVDSLLRDTSELIALIDTSLQADLVGQLNVVET